MKSNDQSRANFRYKWALIGIIALVIIFIAGFYFFGYRYEIAQSKFISITLESFTSKDHSYSISLPKGWFLTEGRNVVRGDHDAVLITVNNSFNGGPDLSIAKMNGTVENLQRVVEWGEQRVSTRINYQRKSLVDYSSPRYSGKLMEYTVGSRKEDPPGENLCKEWLILADSTGYGITMCARPELWNQTDDLSHPNNLSSSFINIIDSFETK